MSEDSENKKNGLTVGGVSGSKKMRLGRVHKKSDKGEDSAAAPAAAVKPAPAPAAEPAPAPEAPEKAPAAEKPAKKEAAKKTEDSVPAKKTAKTSEKAKAAKTEEPAEEKKTAAKRTKKTAEAETAKEEAPAKEKPAKKASSKASKVADEEKEAKKEAKAEEPVKAEEPKSEQPKEAPAASEPKAEEKKPEAPASEPAKTEAPAPEEANIVRPAPRPRLSSAVVSLGDAPARGETIRSSTIITYTGRDRKSPARSGGQGGYGGQGGQGGYGGGRGPQRGGGYQGHGGGGGFDKDKDEEPGQKNQFRRPARPKAESPIDEVKKSRTNYAEKSAFDKKHNDNERREGGKGGFADKRHQNRNSQFSGRVNEDGDYDDYSYKKKKKKQFEEYSDEQQTITEIKIPAFITVKEFAEGIGKKSSEIIMALMKLGVMATINQELDFDTACLVADSFGINAELLEEKTEEDILIDDGEGNPENLQPRPPVVVVMGHVDHGKTSLLDRIRSTNVIEGEAGGITQKIGAYTVRLKGRQITFLDTPGHEAFTTMRARGAQFTDIAILVVAADDGVMPQTIEAINHARAANTEIIVAINKIDKPGANLDKVKQELTNYELICEEWGGNTIMVPISAKKGIGIDDLLENVLLTADIMELKADPTGQAKGAVIEAQLDKNRGPVASVLVQRGTLKQGDTVVCGPIMGNIRAMYDDKGNPIKKAGPSVPVEILGLPEVPEAGELLYAVTDDKTARQLVEKRKIKQREEQLHRSSKMSLETLAEQMAAGDVKDLNIIIKADDRGSVEAVQQSLEKLSNDEVKVKVVHGGVGAINESDIVLADVSNAIIIGFNVRPNQMIIDKAKEAGVDIRLYSVIYNAIEDVENAMKGMLAPKIEEVITGHAEVRQLFKVSGIGTIGGCYVTDGKITRGTKVRVIRDGVVAYTGELGSLQHEKDSVKEAVAGHECGLTVEKYNDIKVGDVIEAFGNIEVARD
ncbi:MAG: translation initiation factor IF-2 [Clostridiales bacterium]|nr:translation initiation factor IF-2 [Clostridiales bacterium]